MRRASGRWKPPESTSTMRSGRSRRTQSSMRRQPRIRRAALATISRTPPTASSRWSSTISTPSAAIRGPPMPTNRRLGCRSRRARTRSAAWASPEASPADTRIVVTLRLQAIEVHRLPHPLDEGQGRHADPTRVDRLRPLLDGPNEIAPLRGQRIDAHAGVRSGLRRGDRAGPHDQIRPRHAVAPFEARDPTTLASGPTGPEPGLDAGAEGEMRLDLVESVVHEAAPPRANPDPLLPDPTRDPVEVVQHQVLDHVDVQPALSAGRRSLDLDSTNPAHAPGGLPPGPVVPLDVADLQDPSEPSRLLDQLLPFRHRGGERLLDEQIESVREQCARDLPMGPGRHRDDPDVRALHEPLPALHRLETELVG